MAQADEIARLKEQRGQLLAVLRTLVKTVEIIDYWHPVHEDEVSKLLRDCKDAIARAEGKA